MWREEEVRRSVVTHRTDQIVRAEEIQNDTIVDIVVHSIGGRIVSTCPTEIGISQSFDIFVECLETRETSIERCCSFPSLTEVRSSVKYMLFGSWRNAVRSSMFCSVVDRERVAVTRAELKLCRETKDDEMYFGSRMPLPVRSAWLVDRWCHQWDTRHRWENWQNSVDRDDRAHRIHWYCWIRSVDTVYWDYSWIDDSREWDENWMAHPMV